MSSHHQEGSLPQIKPACDVMLCLQHPWQVQYKSFCVNRACSLKHQEGKGVSALLSHEP